MSHRGQLAVGRWFGVVGVAAVVSACHPSTPPQEPISLISQMCCKVANEDLTQFAGCREDHRSCEDDEPIWIRGAVTCSEVREATCVGGRCCKYRPQYGSEDAVLTWEPAPSPDDNAGEATDREPSAEAKPEAAPSTPSTDSAQEPPPAKSDTESPEN